MSVEPAREFVDANILVYAFDASAGKKRAAAEQLTTFFPRSRFTNRPLGYPLTKVTTTGSGPAPVARTLPKRYETCGELA
jgi:hypothetical protein